MSVAVPSKRPHRVVLVGGGHAHVHVLRAFAQQTEPGVELILISPEPAATYTGMVPGVIAGQYRLHQAQIDLAALAARAAATFVPDRVCQIDADRRRLLLRHHEAIAYDLTSFDIGAQPVAGDITGDAPVVWVKPIERALARFDDLLSRPPLSHPRQVVIVGAGAGGVELSFALRARLRGEPGAGVTLCDRKETPVPERGARASRLVAAALAAQGITFLGGVAAERVDASGVYLAGGRKLAADLVVWSTGAAAPPLFAAAGLPVDASGFLLVDATLRSVLPAAGRLFAAGDAAALAGHSLPKAGVFAVRQGPVLAANLRATVRHVARLQTYQPQRLFLSLLNTCDGRAILSYGRWALHARWAWTLKDYIDRRFVELFRDPTRPSISK